MQHYKFHSLFNKFHNKHTDVISGQESDLQWWASNLFYVWLCAAVCPVVFAVVVDSFCQLLRVLHNDTKQVIYLRYRFIIPFVT